MKSKLLIILSLYIVLLSTAFAQGIAHQITLPSGMNWCDDSMINNLFNTINTFRVQQGRSPLAQDSVGMKDAEMRAVQFSQYMATHAPNSPGFFPHEGYDTTAASLGYNLISENLAYLTADPNYIVYGGWQDSLHLAALLDGSANVMGVSCVYSGGIPFWTYEPGYSRAAPSPGSTPAPAPASAPAPAATALDSEQSAFLTLINNYRAQNGAGLLQVSATLQNSSTWMSNDLATKNYFSHTDSLGRSAGARLAAFGYTFSPWGENIAAGYDDAQRTFEQWRTACDPDASGQCTFAHRTNMLYGGFVAIGIGRVFNANSAYGWYWTTDFGGVLDTPLTPGTGPAPAPAPAPAISQFRATPSTIVPGQSTILTWSVTGATSVSINGIGNVTNLTSQTVAPGQTTTYTLTVTGAGGTTTASTTVTVSAPTPSPVPAPAPAPAPAPGATPCPGPATEAFTGCYYNNTALAGNPVVIRTDNQINLDGSPDPAVASAGFSVLWQGSFNFAQGGDYVFSAITADGMRLYIDGNPVINEWQDQATTAYSAIRTLSQGPHLLTVQYYQRNGSTSAHLSWQKNDVRNGRGESPTPAPTPAPAPAPAPAPTPAPAPAPGTAPAPVTCGTPASSAFTACYYNNATLSGSPILTRVDSIVNFDWGTGTPDRSISSTVYSVRWQGTFNFAQGDYAFSAITSDGMRLYIDGALVLDAWRDQPATAYTILKTLTEGNHLVVVEYYHQSNSSTAHLSWATSDRAGRR